MKSSSRSFGCAFFAVYTSVFGVGLVGSILTDPNQQSPSPTSAPGRLYVADEGRNGVYIEVVGIVTALECDEVIIEVDGSRTLYERDAVRRLVLGEPAPGSFRQTADRCWVRQSLQSGKPPLIDRLGKAINAVPVIGSFAAETFDSLRSRAARIIVAMMIGIALLLYLSYQVYVGIFVATNVRHLNIDKLSMEIRKLRYDLSDIEKRIGSLPSAQEGRQPVTVLGISSHHFEIPQLRLDGFVKYKILRMLTDDQKRRRVEKWRTKWIREKDKSWACRSLSYYPRVTIRVIAYAWVASFAIGCFVDIFMSYLDPELGSAMMPVFVVLFVLSCALLLRVHETLHIMRDAYKQTFSVATTAIADIH